MKSVVSRIEEIIVKAFGIRIRISRSEDWRCRKSGSA